MKKKFFAYIRSIIEKHKKALVEGPDERELLTQCQEAEDNPLLKFNSINTNKRWKQIKLENLLEEMWELHQYLS